MDINTVTTVKITHLGVTEGSLQIADLKRDESTSGKLFEFPLYVPEGETIELPVTERVLLSIKQGTIKSFLELGLISVELISSPAATVPYDNTTTGLGAEDVQSAIDEIFASNLKGLSAKVLVRNETGVLLAKGTVVVAIGFNVAENRVLVDKASKTNPFLRPALGALNSDVADGDNGEALIIGPLRGINTSNFSLNDQLVLGDNGDFLLPPPQTDPFEGKVQSIGSITRVDSTDGEILMCIEGVDTLTPDGIFSVRETFLRGIVSGGAVSFGPGRDVDITAGTGYVTDSNGHLKRVNWSADTITLPANEIREIYVDENGDIQSSVSLPNFDQNIVLAAAATNASDVTMLASHKTRANQKTNNDHKYTRDVVGPITVSGCITTINSGDALQLDVDAGTYYVTDNRRTFSGASPVTFTAWYRDGSGGWTTVGSQTHIDPNNYDDGSGTLASIPSGEWKKDLLFITDTNGSTNFHVVYGQETFPTQNDAENGKVPVSPDVMLRLALRSGGIVTQEGAVGITSVVDHRPFLGQLSPNTTSVTDHGNLSGLAGDDHPLYLRADGVRSMTGDLDVGTNSITNVSLVDGVDVSDHSSQHNPAGSDALATDAPVTIGASNIEGTANAFARSDHQHDHGDQAGGSLHSEATTGAAGFMSAVDKTKLDGLDENFNGRELEKFFPSDFNATEGSYRVRSVGATGAHEFNFAVPSDFASLNSLELIGLHRSAGSTGNGKDIDLTSEYGSVGESSTTHSETDTSTTYDLSGADKDLLSIDLSPVFSNLSAGDLCGVFVDHKGIGGAIGYLGIRLRYTTT